MISSPVFSNINCIPYHVVELYKLNYNKMGNIYENSFFGTLQAKFKNPQETNDQILSNRFHNGRHSNTTLEMDNVIYIATTDSYAKQNDFKVGGTTHSGLKGRLAQYNVGRPNDDRYFYCYYKKCNDYRIIEKLVSTYLSSFKLELGREMYRIHYNSLKELIEMIAGDLEKQVNFVNSLAKTAKMTQPAVVNPILLDDEVTVLRSGRQVVKRVVKSEINWESLTEKEQESIILDCFKSLNLNVNGILIRTAFEDSLSERGINLISKKRMIWSRTKEVLGQRYPNLTFKY